MTATVECPNGAHFILTDGVVLDHNLSGFENLTVDDQLTLVFTSIIGAAIGYELSFYEGDKEINVYVAKNGVTSIPLGYDRQPRLNNKKEYILGGNAKIIPNE